MLHTHHKNNKFPFDSDFRLSQSPQLLIILFQKLPLLIPNLILCLLAHLLPQRRMERQNIQVLGVIHKPLALELLKRVRQNGPLDRRYSSISESMLTSPSLSARRSILSIKISLKEKVSVFSSINTSKSCNIVESS